MMDFVWSAVGGWKRELNLIMSHRRAKGGRIEKKIYSCFVMAVITSDIMGARDKILNRECLR